MKRQSNSFVLQAKARNGTDGPGEETVYVRTKGSTAPYIADGENPVTCTDSNGKTSDDDGYLPSAGLSVGEVESNAFVDSEWGSVMGEMDEYGECTVAPKGASETWPYEWEAKRKMASPNAQGKRYWQEYGGTMSLHERWARDAETYEIVFTEAWARVSTSDTITARLRGYAYKVKGGTRTPLAGATIRYGYLIDDSDTYAATTTNNSGYFSESEWFDGDDIGPNGYNKGSETVFAAIVVGYEVVCAKHVLMVKDAEPGGTGPGGEVYSILSTLGGITIGSNTNSATFTAIISFYKKVGSAARTAYSCYCSVFRRKGSTYTYIANNGSSKAVNWYVEGLGVSSGTCDALVFCIYDTASNSHSGYLAEIEIPVYKHGDTGPTYWPSGNYDPAFTYAKTGQRTPLVFMEDESVWNEYAQAYGEYWYLTADTNVVNGVHYAPENGSAYWAKAENYGVVMVGAQFARFAKNGAGIMAGDYYYSANGRIDGVERVDGEGADGNAVTASNPPAYTRFMGDPLIQNGYLNRSGLTGPVLSDRAVLQTVSLPRGVTLTVTVRGKTEASGTYGYFAIYKGTTRKGSYTFIMYTSRVASVSFTTTEAGEYTIEYYGSTAATVGTFYLNYEVSGHFYPNWWVDLKTGKMCGAKDNFVIDGEGNVKVNGAMMTHKVKLQTEYSSWVTYPGHAAYEDDYWDTDGDVYLYELESDGLPVRIYSDPDAVYYGLRSCRLTYDQVYVGLVGGTGKRVVIYLPPPHLFVGQRIAITNQAISFPAGSATAGVFLQMDYMLYTRTDYSEGICLTGQDAYFEDDGTGEHDSDGKNGKPYIVGVPERDGAGPIPACGIWIGENVQAINGIFFMSDLVDGLNIEDYEWMELTAVRGYFADKYEGTSYWESTMKYNAYWMLTRWEKKET